MQRCTVVIYGAQVRFRTAVLNHVALLALASTLPLQICSAINAGRRCVTWGYIVQLQYGVLLPLLITYALERRLRATFRDM